MIRIKNWQIQKFCSHTKKTIKYRQLQNYFYENLNRTMQLLRINYINKYF